MKILYFIDHNEIVINNEVKTSVFSLLKNTNCYKNNYCDESVDQNVDFPDEPNGFNDSGIQDDNDKYEEYNEEYNGPYYEECNDEYEENEISSVSPTIGDMSLAYFAGIY